MQKQCRGLMTRKTGSGEGLFYDVEQMIFSMLLFINFWNIGVEEGNEFG